MRYLSQRSHFDRLHQLGKDVAAFDCRFLQPFQRRRSLLLVALLECPQIQDLLFLLLFSRPGQLARRIEPLFVGAGIEEGVDPDDRQFAICFLCSYSIDSSWILER